MENDPQRPAPAEGRPGAAPEGMRPLGAGEGQEPELSVLQLLSILLKHRYLVVGWGLTLAIAVVLVTLVLPRSYTATGSFVPQGLEGGARSGLARMAGQLGLEIPQADPSQSPQFYAELIRTREITGRILADTFEVARTRLLRDTVYISGTLLDLLELDERDPALRRDEGIRWLQEKAVRATPGGETGVVRLSVTTPWPAVSQGIATRLMELVNDFNLSTRQTQAGAEREFIEGRLVDTEARLLAAEEQLRRFLEANRQFQNSPELLFERDRLQRQVTMHQQVFTSLSQAYEDARISEVRNLPLVTVVQPPETPARPDPRRVPFKALVGLLAGAVVGVFHAFGREYVSRNREEGDREYDEFREIWADTVGDVRRVLRRRAV
jgi:uncharacterized protein involved in exopolysaccharide biosynthesis